jgi:hypothetical protein
MIGHGVAPELRVAEHHRTEILSARMSWHFGQKMRGTDGAGYRAKREMQNDERAMQDYECRMMNAE